MTPATTFYATTGTIITQLQAAVEGVQLPEGFDPAGPAFGNVELFDAENLADAFAYLTIVEQRVCVIVPLSETIETISQGMKLIVRRVRPVALIISDRVIGSRKEALWGNATTPGAMGLMELTLPAVCGQLIDNPNGVVSEPSHVSVMSVKDTAKKLPNRIAVILEVKCRGGRLEAPITAVP
jgi:hypothetical protein